MGLAPQARYDGTATDVRSGVMLKFFCVQVGAEAMEVEEPRESLTLSPIGRGFALAAALQTFKSMVAVV